MRAERRSFSCSAPKDQQSSEYESYRTVLAAWNNYEALYLHFKAKMAEKDKQAAMYEGLNRAGEFNIQNSCYTWHSCVTSFLSFLSSLKSCKTVQ